MVQGWRRFHLLLVILTLCKHAIGYPSWNSQVNPRSLRYHKAFSPRGSKSLSDGWVTGNIPVYVNSNVLAVKSPSRYQLGSASGTYESLSQTPSSQSGSVPASSVSSQCAPASPAYAKVLSSSGTSTSHATSRQGSRSQFTSTSQDSSRSKLIPSSSQFVSAQGGSASLGGLSSPSRSTFSQSSPVSSGYPSPGSLSMAISGTSSVKTSQFLSSGSLGGSGRLATSHLSGLAQGVSSHPVGSYAQSQGSPSRLAFGFPQYASASMAGAHTSINQHKQVSAQSLSQIPQKWQPSATSFSQGSPTSAAMSQSRFSVPSAPASSKTLASGGHLGQSAPASLYFSASMPSPQRGSGPYSQASGDVLSLSQSQAPQRWQPSASLSSQGFQTSSSAVSQSSSPSQSAKFPNKFSLASGSGPSHPVSTLGVSSYGGLTQSLGSSAHYAPAYSKPSSPLGDPSLFTSHYASKSQTMAGGTVDASRRYVSTQREVGSNLASLKPQAAAGHYAPAPSMDVKVPVYSHATSSGSSMSSSLQSQTWQPTTSGRLSSPSSNAALTQTNSAPQNVQSSSRFSSVAEGTSRLSTQTAGSYTGPSQSQDSFGPYTSGSPAYEKFGSSSLGVSSQSASGQSSSSKYSPISTTGASGQLTSSSGYLSAQGESGSAHYAPAYSKPASPLGDPSLFTSSQSHYASKPQSMAGVTEGASRHYVSAQREVDSNIASLKPQVAAGHYAPAPSMDVIVPVYSHATSSGSSMSSRLQSQTWQPTTSGRLFSRFPSSGAALTQTSSSPQNVQSSSRFSSVAEGTSRLSAQSAGSYTGPSQSQGSVGPYTSGSTAYEKFGSSSLGVSSQSASGPSSSSQYSPISTTGAIGQLTSSSGYLSGGESGSYIGSSLFSQGTLAKETRAPMDTSMPVSSKAAAVSSGIQASGATEFQSGSSHTSSSLSSLHALSSPVYFVPQSASGGSQVPPFGDPTDSMSQSSGSNVQASSEGVSSASSQAQTLRESAGFGSSVASLGMTGGSTSVLSGSYESSFGQSAPVSKPSRGFLSGYYGVKG